MIEDAPLIYGIEYPARSLSPQYLPSSSYPSFIRFIVGTQSLRSPNQLHIVEYSEETNTFSKVIFKHEGELWWVGGCPSDGAIVATCHRSSSNPLAKSCGLFRFPIDVNNSIAEEDSIVPLDLIKLAELKTSPDSILGNACSWEPDDGHRLTCIEANKCVIWDIDKLAVQWSFESKGKSIDHIHWSPHSNASILGIGENGNIYGIDIRIKGNSPIWHIESNHWIRDMDFNPNGQYYIASGADNVFNIWDIRNTKNSVISRSDHHHWIYAVRYNQFHDQLILTCSSDCKVILSRINSCASKPFGHILDEEVQVSYPIKDDGIVSIFDEHEDSVYQVEWSTMDSWTFASLSFDGRLVINKVPKIERSSLLHY